MTAAFPDIEQALDQLKADRARPAFIVGETVKATLGPTSVVGTVASYQDRGQPLLTIHPHGLKEHPFSTMDVWVDDGWRVEHIVEVP